MSPTQQKRRLSSQDDEDAGSIDSLAQYRLSQLKHCEVYYIPSIGISSLQSSVWYSTLIDSCAWYQPKLKVYGKQVIQSRSMAVYAKSEETKVRYSGTDAIVHTDCPEILNEIWKVVENQCTTKFEHCMVNRYDDGSVYIGPHRDIVPKPKKQSQSRSAAKRFKLSESASVSGSNSKDTNTQDVTHEIENQRFTIASLSLGGIRTFILNFSPPKASVTDDSVDTTTYSISLADTSLIIMRGAETQKFWKHEIPKESSVKKGRISLTFRGGLLP